MLEYLFVNNLPYFQNLVQMLVYSCCRGERVMGLLPRGAASTTVSAIPELVWPVPKHWTLEDAVTVPSAFAHAYYILVSILSFFLLFAIKSYYRRSMLSNEKCSLQ